VLQIKPFVMGLPALGERGALAPDVMISGVCGVILLVLTVWLMIEAVRVLSAARLDRVRAYGK
jgi:hypothetical protein